MGLSVFSDNANFCQRDLDNESELASYSSYLRSQLISCLRGCGVL